MNVYLIRTDDHTPDALRSTTTKPMYTIETAPPRGNSGHHPVIANGWLGTTNDICRTAMGAFDLDDEADRDRLTDILADCNLKDTVTDILDLSGKRPAGEAIILLEIDDEFTRTKSCKYNPDSGDEWWPILNDGWKTLDSYADGNYGNDCFSCGLDVDEIRNRLDTADIEYDEIYEHSHSHGSSTMICFNVREGDYARGRSILRAPLPLELAEIDDE